jgi:transcriptional regulator with XRE-family HTH domain
MSLGDRVLARRKSLGLTREDVESKVDFTAKTIEAIEKGSKTTFDKVASLAAALETTVAFLSGETDDPSPNALRRPPVDLGDDFDAYVDPEAAARMSQAEIDEAIRESKKRLQYLREYLDLSDRIETLEKRKRK